MRRNLIEVEVSTDNGVAVTILKDSLRFHGINMEGCILSTDRYGHIEDVYTSDAMDSIKKICTSDFDEGNLKLELRLAYLEESLRSKRFYDK